MWKTWRVAVLLILLVGPVVAYVGFGALWLRQRGWLFYAFLAWTVAGMVFAYLTVRWTRSTRMVLPPIDWEAPRTFAPHDRQAWDLVQHEAERCEEVPQEELTRADIYIDVGRNLAKRLAAHYHPLSTDPIENVAVVDLLTALELAAEDLSDICREVPGGDMVTPAHLRRAQQAANVIQKASDWYGYLLPLFQPMTGLVRLGTQKLMVQPAWRSMQQNLLRYLFRAYVNRLGTHLIELYSGRLAIGADQYRRLKHGRSPGRRAEPEDVPIELVVAVTGARDAGKTSLIAALEEARAGDLAAVKTRLNAAGFDEDLADLLRTARFVEIEGYTVHADGEHARDRSTRKEAIEDAADSDFLLLVIDARRPDAMPEARFLVAWDEFFATHPRLEAPPALAVLTGADRPEVVGDPTGDGLGAAAAGLRDRVASIRSALPPSVADVVPVGLGARPPIGIADRLLPEIAPLLHRAERAALIRRLHHESRRSKAGRLFSQVGKQGLRLWEGIRARRKK